MPPSDPPVKREQVKREQDAIKPDPDNAEQQPVPAFHSDEHSHVEAASDAVSQAVSGDLVVDEPAHTRIISQLAELLSTDNAPALEVLESAVQDGVQLIDAIAKPLEAHSHLGDADVDNWLAHLRSLQARAKPTRTVVGVVGNTGAGKSSVINALLDEERLLPTNCLRACTASPTEISYNYSDDPEALYRGEVEFISREDWVQELRVLFKDLLDGNGDVSRDCTNSDSDAGVAYAKLRAVYPRKTREMLAQARPEAFAEETAVRRVLGTTIDLQETSSRRLYQGLQRYVDSKEKADNRSKDADMEFWPLIKVVRIYTKAAALSTGAVIVDLPGVQDSNAARAAVAENYMKTCSGLWIVAPITRAVDDKTAKFLLGDSFRRQLKFDGIHSAVTFICSKTDDISITEAADSLNIEDEIFHSWDRAERLLRTKDALKEKVNRLRAEKGVLGDKLDECEAKYDTWEELEANHDDGKTVYAPTEASKKRKRATMTFSSRKSRTPDGFDRDSGSDFEDGSDKENSQPVGKRTPLTADDIARTLASLKAERKVIREDRRALDQQVSAARDEMTVVTTERDALLAEVKATCIKGRNEYSRRAIKLDFAMGIKELDQENAAEEDDENFDPEQDLRDYDQVAQTLPVFCVSSRAYQKLSGKLLKDDFRSHGYMTTKDTEMPQLQDHAKKLTEAGRTSACRGFLNNLQHLVNSLTLWANDDGTHSVLTGGEKRREEKFLRQLLNHLEKGFDTAVEQSISSIELSLEDHIYSSFNASIPLAIAGAVDTATGWGAHRNEGGMLWATYKATCRRNGVYHGAAGPRDFNEELFEPVSRHLATGWERAFQRRLPATLREFAKTAASLLNTFHRSALERARERRTNVSGVAMLESQMRSHGATLMDVPGQVQQSISELQREASREFTPQVSMAMTEAYEVCTSERGPGSYARMKAAMVGHVESERHDMFRTATDHVAGRLENMSGAVRKQLFDRTGDIFAAVFRDYMAVLVGASVDPNKRLSREMLKLRADVKTVMGVVDTDDELKVENL